jgi:ApaG protein
MITEGIKVSVESDFIARRSMEARGEYVFSYTVRISNEGSRVAQLQRRHWIITDAQGGEREVEGEGVVGAQPVLGPGESFEYTSGCVLQTPHGALRGSYTMLRPDGSSFEAQIDPTVLAVPNATN